MGKRTPHTTATGDPIRAAIRTARADADAKRVEDEELLDDPGAEAEIESGQAPPDQAPEPDQASEPDQVLSDIKATEPGDGNGGTDGSIETTPPEPSVLDSILRRT